MMKPAFWLALWGIKNPLNLGSFLRLEANFGAEGTLTQDDRLPASLKRGMLVTAPHFSYKWRQPERNVDIMKWASDHSAEVVAVETKQDCASVLGVDFQHPRRAIYVFGSEDYGLDMTDREGIWMQADERVYIPTAGKESLNVAQAGAIVAYDRLRQSGA